MIQLYDDNLIVSIRLVVKYLHTGKIDLPIKRFIKNQITHLF